MFVSFYKHFKIRVERYPQINVVTQKQELDCTRTRHSIPVVIFPNR